MTDTTYREPDASLVTITNVTYALHALGLAIGAFGTSTVVGSFLFGWPSIIAVIINYVKRDEARGTWLESHITWQIPHVLVRAAVGARHRRRGRGAGDRARGLRHLDRGLLRPGPVGHLPHRARLAGAARPARGGVTDDGRRDAAVALVA